jgi:hypothetical protein
MSSSLRISSDRTVPVTVWVEPWGRDYTLLPGDEYRFTAVGAGQGFYFHVSWQEKDMLLYAEGTCEDVAVHEGVVELPCGHKRQHRTDRVF